MAKKSKIEWLRAGGRPGSSWNPWYGCTEVSMGCRNCYARAWAKRCGRAWEPTRAKPGTLRAPLHWPDPHNVFVCSLSDFWHPAADACREEAWDVILQCPQHTFMLLTKRPDRIGQQLPPDGIPDNVWLGVTVEDEISTWRTFDLVQWDATVRFLSCEPLIEEVNLYPCLAGAALDDRVSWVIVGGESGPGGRAMLTQWVRRIRDQCGVVDVPFYLKQLGGHPDPRSGDKATLDGVLHKAWPDATS